MSGEEFGREDVSPEVLVFAERDLQLDRVGVVSLSCEHGESMVEDGAASLDTLIEPASTMPLFI